jgi:hypothetical protein
LELPLKRCLGSHREHRASVAVAFRTSDEDLEPLEIEILHAQVEAFVEAQTGAVEEEPNEAVHPLELPENGGDLGAAEYLGQVRGPPCANEVERLEPELEDLSVQEEKSAERLVLRGSCDVSLRGEVRQKGADIPSVEFARMLATVEENEAPNPSDVGVLGAPAVVARSHVSADLVKQSRGWGGGSRTRNLQREGS